VSLYIPVPNQVCLPLGEMYVSQTFAVIVSVVSAQRTFACVSKERKHKDASKINK